jgi:prepilin-type processing-associated H-X9-DG protein
VDDNEQALPWSERFWTAPSNEGMNFTDPALPNFKTNFYAQLRQYVGKDDGFWYYPSAKEDTSLTVAGNNSPLIGYMANMYAIGTVVSPWPEAKPKRVSQLLSPSHAKLFTDNGANWQGASVGVTMVSLLSAIPTTPVALHRGGINVALADGAARHVNKSEFQKPGGPSSPFPQDTKQNWWREGAVELAP